MRKELSSHIQINAYLTPPNSQALNAHHDSHDVIVIQAFGTKDWYIHGKGADLPLSHAEYNIKDISKFDKTSALKMQEGNALYIPRGWVHQAIASEAVASLHITISIHPKTYSDLLFKALQISLLENSDLRKALPLGWMNSSKAKIEITQFLNGIEKQFFSDELHKKSLIITEHQHNAKSSLIGDRRHFKTVSKFESINLETELITLDNATYNISHTPQRNTINVWFENSEFELSNAYVNALEFVLNQKEKFTVLDIPILDDLEKISFAKELIIKSCLNIVN
ncbi:hypothetical protein H4J73_11105 [Colwellia sp. MB3u-41]|nr:hypothetical protein [Colwellia sp. MB3u-41]